MTWCPVRLVIFIFFFQAEDGIRDIGVTGVQTCALPISTLPRQDVVEEVWSLWLDIDHEAGDERLRALAVLGVEPTFTLFSGRGWWGHFRLSAPVSKLRVEALNRGLIAAVGDEVRADSDRKSV